MAVPRLNSMDSTVYRYGLLSAVLLCVIQPLDRLHFVHVATILWFAIFSFLLVDIFYKVIWQQRDMRISYYTWICFYYAVLIAGVGLIHMTGLMDAPGGLVINAQGSTAKAALKHAIPYALDYIFFPFMLIWQSFYLRKIDVKKYLLVIIAFVGISAGIALFQKYVDLHFLHSTWWGWKNRYEGLATDPNALALTLFLILPMVVVGMRTGTSVLVRLGCVVLLGLLILTECNTGTRTAAAGMLLFLLLWPLVLSISERHWGLRLRAALAAGPFVFVGVVYQFLPVTANYLGHFGGAATRLSQTWNEYEQGGVSSVFGHQEARGQIFAEALKLIEKSPLAGWGPGGFYREHSNLAYQQGLHQWIVDSPLNHYLMIACDFGIPMMMLNALLILMPLVLGILVFRKIDDVRYRYIVLVLVVANILFLLMINMIPPSYFLGVLWVWTSQLVMLMLMAEKHGVCPKIPSSTTGRRTAIFSMALMALLILTGAYHTAFGTDGYKARLTSPWWLNSIPNTKG